METIAAEEKFLWQEFLVVIDIFCPLIFVP